MTTIRFGHCCRISRRTSTPSYARNLRSSNTNAGALSDRPLAGKFPVRSGDRFVIPLMEKSFQQFEDDGIVVSNDHYWFCMSGHRTPRSMTPETGTNYIRENCVLTKPLFLDVRNLAVDRVAKLSRDQGPGGATLAATHRVYDVGLKTRTIIQGTAAYGQVVCGLRRNARKLEWLDAIMQNRLSIPTAANNRSERAACRLPVPVWSK